MVEKKSLNVKIPIDLYEKIESSGRTQVAIIEEALRKYFDSEKVVDTTKQVEDLKREVIQLTERISSKDNEIRTLNESIGRAYSEMQWFKDEFKRVNDRTLALVPSPEEITKKNWWQFWKK